MVDAISQANTLQKVIYLNSERDRLQSECNSLVLMKQLFPAIDISEDLRFRQELLNQCGQLLNQLGSDVITDETQITAADIERKRLEAIVGNKISIKPSFIFYIIRILSVADDKHIPEAPLVDYGD